MLVSPVAVLLLLVLIALIDVCVCVCVCVRSKISLLIIKKVCKVIEYMLQDISVMFPV